MSSSQSSLPGSLSGTTVAQWKLNIENEALSINALLILEGREDEPSKSNDPKGWKDYWRRRSAIAGYIRKSLDHAQTLTILKGIKADDPEKMYAKLVDYYEPKTAQSRAAALLNLFTIRKKDDETYADFGARVVAASSQVSDRLGDEPDYEPEDVQEETLSVVPAGSTTAVPTVKKVLITPSSYEEGYTAFDLVNNLMQAIVILGLPQSSTLRDTLTHKDSVKGPDELLDHLRREDMLNKTDELVEEAANATANSKTKSSKKSKGKKTKPSKAKFECKVHGPNKSHGDKDCIVQKRKAKEQKEKQAAGNAAQEDFDEEETAEETA